MSVAIPQRLSAFLGSMSAGGMNAAAGGSGPPPPSASLSFDGINDFLELGASNFDSLDRSQFSVILSVYFDNLNSNETLYSSYDQGTGPKEFDLRVGSNGSVRVYVQTANEKAEFETLGGVISSTTQYAIKVDVNTAAATATDRLKLTINNAAATANDYVAPTATMQDDNADWRIGAQRSNGTAGNFFDGLIYQPTIISGNNPADADVFDGSAGKLKALAGLQGAFSLLDASTPTFDAIKEVNWTNNGGVTTSPTIP